MTNQPAQIVAFPFPKRDWNECEDPREAIFQLKLHTAQMLNDAAEGRYVLTETNREGVHEVNALCRQVGLTPLDF